MTNESAEKGDKGRDQRGETACRVTVTSSESHVPYAILTPSLHFSALALYANMHLPGIFPQISALQSSLENSLKGNGGGEGEGEPHSLAQSEQPGQINLFHYNLQLQVDKNVRHM